MAGFKIAFLCALLAPAGLLVGAATMSVEAPCAVAIQNQGGFFVAWCPTTSGCAHIDPRPDCTEDVAAGVHTCMCGGEFDEDRRCASSWTEWPSGDVKAVKCTRVLPCLMADCRETTVPAPVEPGVPGTAVYACECVTPGVGGH